MKAVLSIAGSDTSGGAGIQADIKTISAHGLFAETVITALTAQNTLGVTGVEEVSAAFVGQQIDAVFDDIVPDAVKIGMVSSREIIEVIAEKLTTRKARNIVVDPVMVSTSGSQLINDEAIGALKERLIPLADVVTPNLPEAEVLCGYQISNKAEMEQAARDLSRLCRGTVLVKGGHMNDRADDVFVGSDGEVHWLSGEHIETKNTHGTGCTLSSAIACNLALGKPIYEALAQAKAYVSGAIKENPNLGKGNGPLNHLWNLKR